LSSAGYYSTLQAVKNFEIRHVGAWHDWKNATPAVRASVSFMEKDIDGQSGFEKGYPRISDWMTWIMTACELDVTGLSLLGLGPQD
jgi:hypothetical protein